MPNFDLISDTHLDFYEDASEKLEAIQPTSQILVIAGDFAEMVHTKEEWYQILASKYAHVLYVLGNHEYYRTNTRAFPLGKLPHLPPNMHLLNNSIVSIEGKVFAGTTLWFPDDPMNVQYERFMADFNWIRHFKPWVYQQHAVARDFLMTVDADVWITHHLPFWKCVNQKFERSNINRFFVAGIEGVYSACKLVPEVIAHGHTHEQVDLMVGPYGTRVVANPYGYPQETNGMPIQPKLVEF